MKISINVDGVEVVGVISVRTICDLVVEIEKPYSGYSTTLHQMPLARSSEKIRYGFLGEYGLTRATQMLQALYEAARAIHEDASIVDLFRPFYERARELEMTGDEYRQRRLELRQRLRNREIDNNTHSLLAKALREEQGRRNWEADVVRDEFVTVYVPSARCVSARDSIWRVLTRLLERGVR